MLPTRGVPVAIDIKDTFMSGICRRFERHISIGSTLAMADLPYFVSKKSRTAVPFSARDPSQTPCRSAIFWK